MATNQRLSASIQIGGALSSSFKTAVGGAQGELRKVSTAISNTTQRQKLLGRTIEDFAKQGKDVSRLRHEYAAIGREIEALRRRQIALNRIRDAGLGGAFGNMANQIKGLAVRSAAFVAGFGAGIFGLAKSTADTGDRVAKLADNLGIGIERLQELEYAAERGGLSSDAMGKAIADMNVRLVQAAAGSGEAAAAIEKIGLNAGALAAMSPDEAILAIADALENVENMNERAFIATRIFGEEAGKKLPVALRGGSKALKDLFSQAQATGYVLSETAARDAEVFSDSFLNARLSVVGVKNTLGAVLMPTVTRVMDSFSSYVKENRDQVQSWAVRFGELAERAVPALLSVGESFVGIASTIGTVTQAVAGLLGGFDNLGILIGLVFSAKAIASVITFGVAMGKTAAGLAMLATGATTAAGAFKALGVALISNPIGLIVAGIAGSIFLIYKYWEPISEFVSNLFSAVGDKLAGAWDNIKSIFSWSPMETIRAGWDSAIGYIKNKIDFLGGAMNKVRSFFGFGGERGEIDAIQSSPQAQQTIAAVAPQRQSNANAGAKIDNRFDITITTQPGQDARQIVDELERRQRERERSALYDQGLSYGY